MRRVNISIDDVTPHPRSSIRVVDQCHRILERVPSAKFTLFVPTAYWRTVPAPPESVCERPLFLREHPEFCKSLRSLEPEVFEIGFHGHHHGIPGVSNNDELKNCGHDAAQAIYNAMFSEVSASGLEDQFKMILRPPAWRMSPDAFDAARGVFDILALNPGKQYEPVYSGKQWDDHWSKRVVFQDASPPIVDFPDVWDTLEIVTHACEWDRNYLSTSLADQIADLMVSHSAVGSFIGELRGQV